MIASISKEPDAVHVYFTASNEQEEALVMDISQMIQSEEFDVNELVIHPGKLGKQGPMCVCLLFEPKLKA